MRQARLLFLLASIAIGASGCLDVGPSEPICGVVLYEEMFDGVGSGWPQSVGAEAETSIDNGRYRLEVSESYAYVYAQNEEQGPFTDFCYSALLWDRSGEAAQAGGLVFRRTEDGRFYIFSISPDSGAASFAIFTDGRARAIHTGNVAGIRGVGDENLLQVVAEGSHFLLYVNGELAFDVYDERLSAGGIGVYGASWDAIPAVLEFDDVRVRQLQ